jgi:RND family efflux transporter MFP subunit
MKRHFTSLFLLAALALGACSKPEPPPEPARAVRTVTLQAGTAGGAHEYAAEVRARTESRLGFRVGGKLIRRAVDPGDAVKKGQLLAQLDPQDLMLGQDAALAAVNAAEVNATLAAAGVRRFKDLRDQGFISSAELERRDATLKAAQAQLQQARAQAGVQGNQAGYSTLTADAAGVITAVDADTGAVVSAGAPVVRLAWDGPRDVVFSVPEDRVAAMRALLGKTGALKVRVWGIDAEPLRATLREVSAAADPSTRTFLVKADVGTAPLRLGQTVSVTVDLPPLAGVIKLPLTAVLEQQGQSVVWVLDKASMTVKIQPIAVAGADGNEVVVAGGLQPGQVVVTAGVHTLSPGQKVTLFGAVPGPSPAASR